MNDILTDENDDLSARNGDFIVGKSNVQHQRHLIIADKGQYKQNPTIGVGAQGYLDDEDFQDLVRAIQKEITADGQQVKKLKIDANGKIIIEADFK